MTKKKNEENFKEEQVITGTVRFCVPISDLEKIKKNPKGKIAKKYKDAYIDMLANITLTNITIEDAQREK